MATLESNDANIIDAESINLRLVIYPILLALVVIVGGFSYYYYLQSARESLENEARAALLQAKTPEAMVKVADQYPRTNVETIALLKAAEGSFSTRDFPGALADYRRIVNTVGADAELRDTAQLGLASVQETTGKLDDAVNAYLEVARRQAKSPYAPYGYNSAARIYEQRGDKIDERKILAEMATLDNTSTFVKQAQYKLKQMAASSPTPLTVQAPATNAAPANK